MGGRINPPEADKPQRPNRGGALTPNRRSGDLSSVNLECLAPEVKVMKLKPRNQDKTHSILIMSIQAKSGCPGRNLIKGLKNLKFSVYWSQILSKLQMNLKIGSRAF